MKMIFFYKEGSKMNLMNKKSFNLDLYPQRNERKINHEERENMKLCKMKQIYVSKLKSHVLGQNIMKETSNLTHYHAQNNPINR